MAEMKPPVYKGKKENAEYKVFNMFKNATVDGADKWVVFHSKKINRHIKQMNGEIDFLVLVPGSGVVALEVKGGKISVKNDLWYTGQDELKKDPFKQVEQNINSLVKEYEKARQRFPFFTFGVMFPDCNFKFSREISYPNWRIFDKSDSENIISYIINLLQKSHELYKLKYRNQGKIPSKEDINNLVKFLTLDQEITPYSTWVNEIEESQEKFSNEQKKRLYDSTVGSSRCLIEGYTGTGKTIIAVETAKAAFNKPKPLTVGVFCYNSLLSKYLKNKLKDNINDNSFVGHLHEFLLKRIKEANLKLLMPSGKDYFEECKKIDQNAKIKFPEEVVNNDDFWEKTVPQIASEALKLSSEKYDKIILDEGQDIFIYDSYIDIIDKILIGGIQNGKWTFFADPQQDISNSTNKMSYDVALGYLGIPEEDYHRPPPLTESWRNSKKITEEISKLIKGGASPQSIEEGIGPEYIPCSSIDNQKQLIEERLDYLLKDGILREQITILTVNDPHQDLAWYENSVISTLSDKYNLVEYKHGEEYTKGKITYSSVNIFKGMENSVIFVVDVKSYTDKNLLYVGMSRARSILKVFKSKQAERE